VPTHSCDALVISAHPDDAEFGAAGTVAGWTRQGKSVVYVICTSGEKGTADRSAKPDEVARLREAEQQAAGKVLGVRQVEFLRYPDQGLEDTPELRKHIVQIIRTWRPHTVVTSDPYRRYLWHRDHRMIGRVVVDALYPYARDHLAYPDLIESGLEPHKVKEALFWGADDVNHRVDITATFDAKVAALRCHASQVETMGFEDLEKWLRKRCRKMASSEAFELAEAFHRLVLPP